MPARFPNSVTLSRPASLLALTLLLGVLLSVGGCHRAAATGDKNAQAVLTVETIHLTQRVLPTDIDTAGVLAAWQEISIGSEVTGYRVNEVLVDVGSSVKKGQVLARLEDTLLRADVDQHTAALAEAEASFAEAKANADRVKALMKTGAISQQDMIQKTTAAATAAARVTSAKAQLVTAEHRLKYATIVAPDYGVISARLVSPGQLATGNGDLFRMIRQNRVEWRAEVPETQLAKVRVGMGVKVKRGDGTFAIGRIRAIAPSLDTATRRGIAYADLKLDSGLRPGMFVTGTIQLGKQEASILPLSAVTVRDGFSYVFVVGAKNKVAQRRIQVGRFFSDGVEVLDGVTEADPIVSQGAGFLHDGDVVRVAAGELAKS